MHRRLRRRERDVPGTCQVYGEVESKSQAPTCTVLLNQRLVGTGLLVTTRGNGLRQVKKPRLWGGKITSPTSNSKKWLIRSQTRTNIRPPPLQQSLRGTPHAVLPPSPLCTHPPLYHDDWLLPCVMLQDFVVPSELWSMVLFYRLSLWTQQR